MKTPEERAESYARLDLQYSGALVRLRCEEAYQSALESDEVKALVEALKEIKLANKTDTLPSVSVLSNRIETITDNALAQFEKARGLK